MFKKRRTLIATLAVLGVLFVWWLGSSGVDKRFVGRWIDSAGQTWHFGGDGSFSINTPYETLSLNQRWWVSGNRIVVYTPSQLWTTDAYRWLTFVSRRLTGGKTYSLGFEDYPVTKLDGDTMQLDFGLDLKRVSKSHDR